MKNFTKFLLLMMTIVFSSSLIIAQVNPAISVSNPEAEKIQQSQDLSLQKELDLEAYMGQQCCYP